MSPVHLVRLPFIFEYIRLLIFAIADHISIVVAVHLRPASAHERAVVLKQNRQITGAEESPNGPTASVCSSWLTRRLRNSQSAEQLREGMDHDNQTTIPES
jgi:hypothetical protein